MQMVMNPNETQIQIFDKEQRKDNRKNPELGLKTDSLFRVGWGWVGSISSRCSGNEPALLPETRHERSARRKSSLGDGVGWVNLKKGIKYCTASQYEKTELSKADRTVEVVRWPFLDFNFVLFVYSKNAEKNHAREAKGAK